MSERSELLTSIADTIKDYRKGEIDPPTPEHVDRWVRQFEKPLRIRLLHEIEHVLKQTYLSKKNVATFLSSLVKNKKIAGPEPCEYWAKAHFLKIQQKGQSQKDILDLFAIGLKDQCNLNTNKCGKAEGDFIYLDDVIFSGTRVGTDLEAWIENSAPQVATIHVIVIAIHKLGEYLLGKRIKQAIKSTGKEIKVHYWRAKTIENRKSYRDESEVLWPIEIPEDLEVGQYLAIPQKFPFEPRKVGGKLGPFSSEEGRQLLEREFLIAGVRIRGLSQNPKDILRPLGFSPFGLGFGSMLVTFRNCANNCPLALWWGDPEATSGPFHWYPLLPRKTNNTELIFDAVGF